MTSNNIGVKLSDELNSKLDETIKETGLSKSEIVRRGLLSEIRKLRGDKDYK